MFIKTQAIVLHAIKYGDQKLIIDMFTRQTGRMSFITRLPKTAHSKIKKQHFQPLSLLSIECEIRPNEQLHRLKEVNFLAPLPSLHGDPSKLAISMFLSEFLSYALRDEQQNEPLFDYIGSGIEWLDSCQKDFANFHLAFLMHLSRFLGFYPNISNYDEGDYFDLRAAIFCKHPPVHHDILLPQEASLIRLMMRMDFGTMHLFRMSHEERNQLLDTLLLYYRIHLPAFPELRCLPILRELFR
jgi:DNA repair protein RecO (recombination protein O)